MVCASEYTLNSSLGHTLAVISGNTLGGNTVGTLSRSSNASSSTSGVVGTTPTLHRIGPFGESINQLSSKLEFANTEQRRIESAHSFFKKIIQIECAIHTIGQFYSIQVSWHITKPTMLLQL